jgi:hypothetical protein
LRVSCPQTVRGNRDADADGEASVG